MSEAGSRFFGFHDAHPIALSMLLMDRFGHGWVEWEPETLRQEILQEFQASSISQHNWSKLQAVRTLLRATGFWEEWHVFEKIVQALNNNIPRFDLCQKCSLAQLVAGVDMAGQIRVQPFSEEVAKYVAACAVDEGVTYLPAPLDFAQLHLSEPKYQCLDCGSIAYDDLKDGCCDYCVARYRQEHPLSGKPAPGTPDPVGRNIRQYLVRDPTAAKKRYDEVMAAGPDNVEFSDNSAEDVQAAKLAVATRYMNVRHKQLAAQLEEIKPWIQY